MFKYLVAGAITAYAVYEAFFADNRDDHPPSRPESYESAQSPVRRRDEQQRPQTIDSSKRDRDSTPLKADTSLRARAKQESDLKARYYQQIPERQRDGQQPPQTIDSSQRDDTPSEVYTSLRTRARREGDLMTQCCRQSQEAYQRRDHALAKALSEEAKYHELEMENLDVEASALIFEENNRNNAPGKVDLHGLLVKEAIYYSGTAITEARLRGDSEIRLIVGQGAHSTKGVPRLKPAVQEEMRRRGVYVEVDPRNSGVLVVQLDSR